MSGRSGDYSLADDVAETLERTFKQIRRELRQDGIDSTVKYVKQLNDAESDEQPFSESDLEQLEGVDMRALTRAYPGGDQNIMMTETNPRLNSNSDFFDEDNASSSGPLDFLAPVADADDYTSEFVTACVQDWCANNFGDSGGQVKYRKAIIKALDEADFINISTNIDEYLYDDHRPAVYHDIYFSNYIKFATDGAGDTSAFSREQTADMEYTNPIDDISKERFSEEVTDVDPDLIIAFGSLYPNDVLQDKFVEPLTDGPRPSDDNWEITELHGEAYRVPEWNDATVVFGLHPANNEYHFRSVDTEYLTDTLTSPVVTSHI